MPSQATHHTGPRRDSKSFLLLRTLRTLGGLASIDTLMEVGKFGLSRPKVKTNLVDYLVARNMVSCDEVGEVGMLAAGTAYLSRYLVVDHDELPKEPVVIAGPRYRPEFRPMQQGARFSANPVARVNFILF
jgi:hypothetical protein